ncbi:hypothetical protein WMY93_033077, partial [Mugilogobius chulae]
MKSRMEGTAEKHIVEAMRRCGVEKQFTTPHKKTGAWSKGRGVRFAHLQKERKASSWSSQCRKPVCKEHK